MQIKDKPEQANQASALSIIFCASPSLSKQ